MRRSEVPGVILRVGVPGVPGEIWGDRKTSVAEAFEVVPYVNSLTLGAPHEK